MNQVKIERQVLLVYDNVFEGDILVADVLRGLPKTPALETITYLLHLYNIRTRKDTDFQSRQLYAYMMQMGGDPQARLLQFVTNYNKEIRSPGFKWIDRRSCLNLIQHLLLYAEDKEYRSLNRSEFSVLFKVLLLFNATEVKHQQHIFNWDGSGSFDEFADGILGVQIRNIENEKHKNYALQFLKIYYFFKFCENDAGYAIYLKTFLDKLGLSSYKSYLWRLLSPYLELQTADEPTPKMHVSNCSGLDFFQRLSINGHEAVDADYKQIRSYPLYRTDYNQFLFLDFRFFVDKFYQGFLFDFATTAGIGFAKLKQQMGEDFSEHTLFYSVMKNCFPDYGDVRLSGAELKSKLGEGEPDYYIRQNNHVALFEFKDILLPASVKYADDIDKIKDGIVERLEKDAKGKRKGVSQLLNSAQQILIGRYHDLEVDGLSSDVIIYPIIVHTDVSLESRGVNYFLNKRMRRKALEMGVTDENIANVVVVHIETLLQLQDYFREGKLDLFACLDAYLSYISSGDPVTDTFPFDEFVKYYLVQVVKQELRQHPKLFTEIIADYERNA